MRAIQLILFAFPIGSQAFNLGPRQSISNSTLRPCKVTPTDSAWPSDSDWISLNASIDGVLIKTRPSASSCYIDNPFNSNLACDDVVANWGFSAFHASVPESIDYPIWANNSCLPPNATGYDEGKKCSIGGLPQFIVNATTEQQVATAVKWAADRNIRIVVKGTGHDLNGRSAGAYSLSVWTHNFQKLVYDPAWVVPDTNNTANVLIAGSGNNWGSAVRFALAHGRVIVSGVDQTVGLGGFIQGGGHGPLSSSHGLSADQVLQASVVTTTGQILVVNSQQNQDLYWAIRGGGGGQYGIVTEFVMLTHIEPKIVSSSISIMATNLNDSSQLTVDAAWTALASLFARLPDVMDAGLAGSGIAAVGKSAKNVLGLPGSPPGPVLSLSLWAFNTTTEAVAPILHSLKSDVLTATDNTSSLITVSMAEPVIVPNYTAFFESMNSAPSGAGSVSVSTSRLLGRSELSDLPPTKLRAYLQRVMVSQTPDAGSMLIIGMQGGPGPREVPEDRRGALNPVWRKAYLHILATGANVDISQNVTPQRALRSAADWMEKIKESVWREWAPDTGAYMNEANPFNGQWQHDFYGESYTRLVKIKKTHDPTESLYVQSGVNSDRWEYDLNTGKLCQRV